MGRLQIRSLLCFALGGLAVATVFLLIDGNARTRETVRSEVTMRTPTDADANVSNDPPAEPAATAQRGGLQPPGVRMPNVPTIPYPSVPGVQLPGQ